MATLGVQLKLAIFFGSPLKENATLAAKEWLAPTLIVKTVLKP
jgi:hypothetical protein